MAAESEVVCVLVYPEKELQSCQREIQNLTIRIEKQELSAEDVEQISKERARLNEQCHLAAQRQKEIQSSIWRQETTIAEQMDAVSVPLGCMVQTIRRSQFSCVMCLRADRESRQAILTYCDEHEAIASYGKECLWS